MAKPAIKPDLEMLELLAVMGRVSSPAPRMAPSAVSNLRQHSFQVVGGDNDPCVDTLGQLMVYASTAHTLWPDIYVKRVDGKTVTQLTTDPASDIQPAISPTGRHIAFASNRSGAYEIYVMTADGKTIQQVTRGYGDNVHPAWSPDGERLVYSCNSFRSGRWEMWVAELNSPSTRQFIGYGLFPAWSPVEDRIAYQRPRARGSRLYGIWTIQLVNGEPSLPTLVASEPDKAFVNPSFSADGKKLAFAAMAGDGATQTDIYTVGLDGESLQQLTKGPGRKYGPAWAAGAIFFSSDRDGQENIWSVQADSGAIRTAADMIEFTPVAQHE